MRAATALSVQQLAGHENMQTTLGYSGTNREPPPRRSSEALRAFRAGGQGRFV